jgi:long-chain acyl-CoA synthetase
MPEVVGAAVIGEPDLVRGEAIIAFVVLRSGAETTPHDIIAHCVERLPNYMMPKEVMLVERLPINAHGKVVKNELRRLAAQPA